MMIDPAKPSVFTPESTLSSDYLIRLYLVRHGETEANKQKIVVGQSDSPLTTLGISQTTSLSKSLSTFQFDKYVSSDLGRTIQTAKLLKPDTAFSLDPRLREMAKGAREGYPKALRYEKALELRRKDDVQYMPLLESNDDVWTRLSEWIVNVAQEGASKMRSTDKRTYHVLAVTHAGAIRSLCSRLVPDKMPQSVDVSDMGRDGSTTNHLLVPNTSVTVLELVVPISAVASSQFCTEHILNQVKTRLKVLTWQGHLKGGQA